ncbi:hypothetical protein TNCV_3065731 [Trichonephila clavipes]|uniref:Uncharacterized protein n=1 Tax=Trichonephila clavipes TaxID=2585209 RepID=A0A8X6RUE0_TRICX|nr:hypothetical protein TNCV_3065731 [Trichonephila clavipes]
MSKIRKSPAGFYCPIASSEESVAVDDDNVCTDGYILKFIQSSKTIINTNYDDENKINNAVPVPMSSEINYLGAHSNSEMNNKLDHVEQFVHNLILQKAMQRKYQINLQKIQ